MSWFANLSTRMKLTLSFGTMILLLIAVSGTAYIGLTAQQQLYGVAIDLLELRADLNRQQSRMLEMIMFAAKEQQDSLEQDIRNRAVEVDGGLLQAASYAQSDPEFARKLEALRTHLTAYRNARDLQFGLIREGKGEEAKTIALREQGSRFEQIRSLALEMGQDVQRYARARAGDANLVFAVVGSFAIVLALLTVAVLNRLMAAPLAAFMLSVERVGRGDLSHQEAGTALAGEGRRDEVGRLGRTLHQMVAGLRDMTNQIRGVTQTLSTSTMQIMASVQQQAASTREQAATIQQITTTMNEVNQSGAQIAQKARQVAAAAEATSVVSNSGMQAVVETTRTMAAIREQVEEVAENIVALSEKTQAVGEIIATVNDIAERSNLLALNAAIEAAAAGTQGTRFSVVANEMKNLADQAKDSTVQVRTILGDIQKGINSSVMLTEEAVKRVEAGKQQSDVADQTIRQMAKTTLDSVQAFEQIIAGGNQQQIGFEQVAQGMKDIRQAASQTAAATAQLEKAVVSLNSMGQDLKQAVERYQL